TFATTAANTAQSNAQTFATTAASNAQSAAQTFATTAANTAAAGAQTGAQTYAQNLVTGGGTVASLASVNVNGGGITNAGAIGGVTAATQSDQAVNFSQLQAVFTQLVQSGLCRINGANVSCGATGANNALVAGSNAQVGAGADNAIALGTNSNAQSAGSIAMGNGARAVQSNSVAIGAGATALSSVAVGTGAQAIGTNTTALGDNALASGNFAVAVGNNASATHANSVALGNGSTTSAANTVSVGSAGAERRVTNVASGTTGTDAVNVMQLNAAVAAIGQNAVNSYAYTDQQIGYARAYAARGIAASSAIPSVSPSAAGKTAMGVGSGYYDGETAVGISVAHAFTDTFLLSGGVAKVSGGKNVARVAVGFEF
ncbi:MAG: YadA-like family protein, partial [Pseudomonadota bacterium]